MQPDWVSAVADVFACVGTVGAFAVGGVLLRREIKRDEDRVDEVRRQQPAAVHAWVEAIEADVPADSGVRQWVNYGSAPQRQPDKRVRPEFSLDSMDATISDVREPPDDSEVSAAFRLEVRNASSGPIFDIYVEQLGPVVPLNTAPQGRHGRKDKSREDWMPKKSVVYLPLLKQGMFELYYSFFRTRIGYLETSAPVAIAFTDCFGIRWHRDRNGVLQQIGINDNPAWIAGAKSTIGFLTPLREDLAQPPR